MILDAHTVAIHNAEIMYHKRNGAATTGFLYFPSFTTPSAT